MTVSLPYEPGRDRVQGAWPASTRSCSARRRRGASSCEPLADHYARRARARRCTTSSAACSRPAAGAGRPPARRPAARGRRRARRDRAGRRARARRCCATGTAPGDDRGRASRARATTRRCSSRSSAPTASRSRSTAACRSAHTGARPRAARAAALRALPGRHARTTCSPGCARPACCDQPALADRLEAAGAPATAPHRAAEARARCGSASAGQLDELDRLAARAPAADAAAPSSTRQPSALFAAPLPARGARSSRGAGARRRARLRAGPHALRELRALAPTRPRRAGLDRRALLEALARAARSRWASRRSPTACRSPTRAPSARAASRRCSCAGCRRASSRAGAAPEPFLPDDDRARASPRPVRAAAAAPRGPARPRALPVLRLRLARRAAARALLAHSRRGGRARSRRSFFVDDVARPVRRACAERAAALARRRHLAARRGADRRASGSAPQAAARPAPRRAAARPRCADRAARSARATRRAVSARALEHFADCPVQLARRGRAAPARSSSPTPSRWCAARRPRRAGAHLARLRGETGAAASRAANLPAAERDRARSALRRGARRRRRREQHARARGGAPARGRPPALPAPRGRARRRLRARAPRAGASAPTASPRSSSTAACACAGRSTASTSATAMALVRDYKSGKRVDRYKVARWEAENRFQAALYMLVVRAAARARAAGGALRAAGRRRPPPARAWSPRTSPELGGDFYEHDRARRRTSSRDAARLGARARSRETAAPHARAASCAARPTRCAWNGGCSYPSICRMRAHERPRFTAGAARAAIERRDGSLLVRAGAGSGKTSVLVERFVRGGAATTACAVERDPRDHVHREGGGARCGRACGARFVELGRRDERARRRGRLDLDDPRLLRAGAARPRAQRRASTRDFRVLDELEAERLGARRVRPRARGLPGPRRGPRAARAGRRLHARPPRDDGAHRLLAAAQPRRAPAAAPSSPPAPGRAGERGAARGRRGERALARAGRAAAPASASRRASARSSAALALGRADRPPPSRRDSDRPRRLARAAGAKALCSRGLRRVPRGAGGATRRSAPSTRELPRPHAAARAAASSSATATSARKRERSGARLRGPRAASRATCCATTRDLRGAGRERFAHVMVDEFQDTNPLQNELLELLERDNLFRVGDEYQSIYGFRHADVASSASTRERGSRRRARRGSTVNFRSRGEVLDAIDRASRGSGASASSRCARRRPRAGAPRRPARRAARRPTASKARWDERFGDGTRTPFGAGHARAPPPWRAPRRGCSRKRIDELIARRAARAARRRRARCAPPPTAASTSARSRSAACRPTSSAAAATGPSSRSADLRHWLAALANPLDELALYTRAGLAARRRCRSTPSR